MYKHLNKLFAHLKVHNINIGNFIITYGSTNTIKKNQSEFLNFQWIYFNLCGLDIESQIQLERLSYRFLNSQAQDDLDRAGLIFYNNLTIMSGLPVIVFGLSGKESVDIKEDQLRNMDKKFRCIRRFTGGGTVVVDNNSLFVSIIAPHQIGTFKSHGQLSGWCYNLLFKPNDVLADGRELDGDFVVKNGNCYKKFGGNAMAMSKNYFVHHSCLLWNFTDSINLLNTPIKQPNYRNNRNHLDFLQPLSFKTNLSSDQFLESLIENCKTNNS
ncbi:lipoate-protein ligase 2 (LipL2) [Babesia microti strain RI]|uniref:Lipoate-protein ligase 2 (LipL2) n=1 Tax=Babesia microti (strain RI) TaxID=1133968 RepID=A0A1R4AAV2_BABMR|nr:lipoate-protein ligase 2 (LipL2) [Babesia microti strain RI]SJK86120.1 lipoate-protein ligase 2 (LipL2) [Babesia microti strain RI]|eukprot:XP_012648480.2 lipoate-protein ligase 2 (LipL2) [Babesia microti strain RI]